MGLDQRQIDEAAALLADARRTVAVIDCIPESIRPRTLADAYAVRDRLVEILGVDTYGWFGACTNESIQSMLGLAEPYYAYLLTEHVYKSPARLDTRRYPPIVFECEFGFTVDRDFTPAGHPYSRTIIEQAVSKVSPVIEIVAGHLRDWPDQDVFSVIADNGTDGALVIGEPFPDWRSVDLVNTPVTLVVNGEIVREGSGANVLGDPMHAFVWLVNALTRDGITVKAGQVHNTGTATDIYWAKAEDRVEARYGTSGAVSLELV